MPSGAVAIGASSAVAAGQGATYSDPSGGGTDIVLRDSAGKLTAILVRVIPTIIPPAAALLRRSYPPSVDISYRPVGPVASLLFI